MEYILVLMITARAFTILDTYDRPLTLDQCEIAGKAWDKRSAGLVRTHECLPTVSGQ